MLNKGLVLVFLQIFWLGVVGAGLVWAQSAEVQTSDSKEVPIGEIYYVVHPQTPWYASPDSSDAKGKLNFRETVWVESRLQNWFYIQRAQGDYGYVPASVLSNVWIKANKSQGKMYVYRGTELLKSFPADFGTNMQDTVKTQRGSVEDKRHWITPEGRFYIVEKNDQSAFYKAFLLSYPRPEDAERGYRKGLVTAQQVRIIQQAHDRFQRPPMNTPLGGMIEIHGKGSGKRLNWTQGCIAIRDFYMDELWEYVQVGTPVLVER